jgi:hypothetical protein
MSHHVHLPHSASHRSAAIMSRSTPRTTPSRAS